MNSVECLMGKRSSTKRHCMSGEKLLACALDAESLHCLGMCIAWSIIAVTR